MTISIVLLLMLSFSVLLSSGVILPANYAEKQFNKYKEQIISSEKVTEDIIPSIYEYGVYTLDGNLISGTFNKKESKEVWNLMRDIEERHAYSESYIKFFKKDEVFIIKYKIVSEYSSPILRAYLPKPETLGMIIFSIIFFIEIVILSKVFGKKFNIEMELLKILQKK